MTLKRFSRFERRELMKLFYVNACPDRKELCQLAKSLNTSHKRVEVWFRNMRHRTVAEEMLFESE